MSASNAVFVAQNLLKPDAINDDMEIANLEVPDAALRNGLVSDRVPVPMLRIALQGFYVFRGASTEEAAELADSVPDGTYRRYQKDWVRGWRLRRAQRLWSYPPIREVIERIPLFKFVVLIQRVAAAFGSNAARNLYWAFTMSPFLQQLNFEAGLKLLHRR